MLKQIINRIEQRNSMEYVALNLHTPCKATYVIVDKNFNYKIISKERFSFNTKYVAMDFYSILINVNKAVDIKKTILSNNYLTFFCKNFDKLTDEKINNYYKTLNTPKECLIYRDWIKENIQRITKEIPKGQLVKVFFLNPIEFYIKEGHKYFNSYILSNTAATKDATHGTSLFLSLNSKKPFLKNLTRRNDIPALVDKDEALKIKFLHDVLLNLAKKGKDVLYILEDGELIPINTFKKEACKKNFVNGIILAYRINNKGEIDIVDMDIVPKYNVNLD